jgi:hypothetical protein
VSNIRLNVDIGCAVGVKFGVVAEGQLVSVGCDCTAKVEELGCLDAQSLGQ